ncbi:hypothetical protein PJ985_05710 [Streptomyces sp. ACA25]|uniref:hypothetical protein n=1 Tax=Streptomyces sp. ACA25 TaxID=3022596 RepID=UPI002307DB64|nr:hypothetical protein [Streptomyces sp. ACA25]MDB1087062.1 hypothetical protein [Streptomyces sp. ACA25]
MTSGARRRQVRGTAGTLALVESPVQLLNVLEWAHTQPAVPEPGDTGAVTVVVLPPRDPASRGQLQRMTRLARAEGHEVLWREARGAVAAARTTARLARRLRRAHRLVIGDPFSRCLQLLLATAGPRRVVVVDDGTATMEFLGRVGRGAPLVRWHRAAPRGPRAALFAPVARRAVRRLSPSAGRSVEVFTAMPVEGPAGMRVTANAFGWTRARFGPPRLSAGADLVGTSLVETGVIREDRYLAAVTELARRDGATRYFAHRREGAAKLRRIAEEAGLEVVRPELPLELVARRGPVAARLLSFPSTVVHTLPLVLGDTPAVIAVCDIPEDWFTDRASPRAGGFLAAVSSTARGAHVLRSPPDPQ